jgi:hypothetical protein
MGYLGGVKCLLLIAGTVDTEQKHNNSGCKLCLFVGWLVLKHAGNFVGVLVRVFWPVLLGENGVFRGGYPRIACLSNGWYFTPRR